MTRFNLGRPSYVFYFSFLHFLLPVLISLPGTFFLEFHFKIFHFSLSLWSLVVDLKFTIYISHDLIRINILALQVECRNITIIPSPPSWSSCNTYYIDICWKPHRKTYFLLSTKHISKTSLREQWSVVLIWTFTISVPLPS